MSLYKSEYDEMGVLNEYHWDDAAETMGIKRVFDCNHIIKKNKEQQTGSLDSRFGNEMMHHVAELPLALVLKFKQEYNLDVMSNDPNENKRLMRLLDDPDYRYLKTTVKKLSRRIAGTT
jgi:hypothetical protein